jgi:hypothetical protein
MADIPEEMSEMHAGFLSLGNKKQCYWFCFKMLQFQRYKDCRVKLISPPALSCNCPGPLLPFKHYYQSAPIPEYEKGPTETSLLLKKKRKKMA